MLSFGIAYKNALDRSIAIAEFKPDGTITHVNENFLRIIGYSKDEVIGFHHNVFVDSVEKNSLKYINFWKSLAAGKFQEGQFKRIAKNGDNVWIHGSYNPVLDKYGDVYKIIKFSFEITDNKFLNAKEANKMAAIYNSLAIAEFDSNGIIKTWNDTFLNTMGYSESEMANLRYSMLVENKYAESKEYKDFWNKLKQGEPQAGIFKRISKSGNPVWIKGVCNPLFDDTGKIYGFIKYVMDVTNLVLNNIDQEKSIENLDSTKKFPTSADDSVDGLIDMTSSFKCTSSDLSELISVIDEIAYQTNLLVLDAVVESTPLNVVLEKDYLMLLRKFLILKSRLPGPQKNNNAFDGMHFK